MEIFEDFATVKSDPAAYAMIPKREFNPELSAFSNLVLDLTDFKDRVRPMAKDLTLFDASRQFQSHKKSEFDQARSQLYKEIHGTEQKVVEAADATPAAQDTVDEGYSSREIPAESDVEQTDVEAAAEPDAAEPDHSVNWEEMASHDEEVEEKSERRIPGQKKDDE